MTGGEAVRRIGRAVAAAGLLGFVLGTTGWAVSQAAYATRPHPHARPAHARPAHRKPARRRRGPRPVSWRVRIPAIRVSAPIIALGVNRDGTIAVPPLSEVQRVGWYRYGAVPGRPGSAVLMGHVDTLTGRAVFYRLYQLRRGARIYVEEGGPPLTFAVASVSEVSKRSFPASVFALTGPPRLYLVTCAGTFDYVTRHYEDNIIVTARSLPPLRHHAERSPPGVRVPRLPTRGRSWHTHCRCRHQSRTRHARLVR